MSHAREPLFEHIERALGAEVTPRRAAARRLADATRSLIHRIIGTEAPTAVLDEAADAVEGAAALFAEHRQRELHEEFAEAANSGDPHAFFERSPTLGGANPLAPPVQVGVEDGVVIGRAHFDSAYEGPPGCVHGGYIAAAFDDVLGLAQSMSGAGGMTGTLTVRYRRPTPLHADVTFEARLVKVEGRKIFTEGVLKAPDGGVTAEAEAVFITVDFEAFVAAQSARKAERAEPASGR